MLTTTAEIAASSLVLTTEELRVISEYAGARVFPKDTIIVKESVRIDSLYIVLEGRVKVFLVGPEGKEVVVSVHGAGEYFGRIGSDEMPMPASVMTVEPSRLILLSKDDLKILLTRNNLFAGRVFEKLVHQVERQSRELSEALQHRTSISEILQAISSSPTNVQAVLDTVAENAGRLCDFTNADILQVEGAELRLVTKYGMDQIWPIGFKIPINRNWVVGRAVADRTSIHVHDLQQAEAEFPAGAGYAKQHGHRTVFARAGHEAPIFIDELGSVKLLPIASGQALGVFDEINLDEQTVALSKGCMLRLYSDGIPDTTNLRNERFGLKGIVRTLSDRQQSPAQKTCGEIINAVNKHQRGSLQHDDMTIVLVRAV